MATSAAGDAEIKQANVTNPVDIASGAGDAPKTTLAGTGNAASIAADGIGKLASDPPVTASKPAVADTTAEEKDVKESPLQSLRKEIQSHSHKEIWGVTLSDPAVHVPSQIILQKYLNANAGDLSKAKAQLKQTLDYRQQYNPAELVKKHFAKESFEGLGYVTTYAVQNRQEVFTWNIYGGVKDIQKTFGNLEAFIEWRVALMEMAMHELDLGAATNPITAEDDPYKMYQVHDYKGTSFFRSPPEVRGAAKKTIEVLAMAYPETLKEKFFINVPAIMGFMYGVMKLFVAPATLKKFHPMKDGAGLAAELSAAQGLGEMLPKEYGGKGGLLEEVAKQPALE